MAVETLGVAAPSLVSFLTDLEKYLLSMLQKISALGSVFFRVYKMQRGNATATLGALLANGGLFRVD